MNIINTIKKNIKPIYKKLISLLEKLIGLIKRVFISAINKSKEIISKTKKSDVFNKDEILTFIDTKKSKKEDQKKQLLTWENFSKNNLSITEFEKNKKKNNKLIKAKKTKSRNIIKTEYFLLIKTVFSICITIYSTHTTKDIFGTIIGLASLLIVVIITNIILNNNKIIGNIFNDIALLIYNSQYLVKIFGGTFISPIMLTNIESLEQIGGRAFIYVLSIIVVLIFTFLPVNKLNIENKTNKILINFKKVFLSTKLLIILAVVDIFFVGVFPSQSEKLPYTAFLTTFHDLYVQEKETSELKKLANSDDKSYSKKYHKKDLGGISDNEIELNIPERPNIVLVFMEGVSSLIMESDKELMPNLNEINRKSALTFENYYNHTFATYRGIIGQLYSGFQKNNLDPNKLISLQEIFQKKEYNTEFINVEPKNATFSKYIDSLNFMKVTNPPISEEDEEKLVIKGVIPDKIAYEYLFDRIEENHKKNEKFFLSMYSAGTHATQNSFDQEYGNGNNNFYNKFYDLDYQIGEFIEKFDNSKVSEDTVVIFTTDHATALEQEYIEGIAGAKDEWQQARIPLFFYYKNAKGQIKADASGRTSLDLAPTILDFLGFKNENSSNYFLGTTLLIQDIDKDIEHICSYVSNIFITEDGEVRKCSLQEKKKYEKELLEYSKAALTGY